MHLRAIIEACLMAAEDPLSLEKLMALFPEEEKPTIKELKNTIQEMMEDSDVRGVQLVETATGFRFQTKKEYATYVNKLWETKPPKYSRAFLESLAIIAYKQPVTRGEIEDVRGVAVASHHIKAMIERGWVKEVGHKEVPGRPALLATTKSFLDYFALNSLEDLPPLAEVKAILGDDKQQSIPFDDVNEDLAALYNDHEPPKEESVDASSESVQSENTSSAEAEDEVSEEQIIEEAIH